MKTNNDAQCKLCRAAGKKLMLKGDKCASAKCTMNSNPTPPGFHGAKRKAKVSQYGQQLAEKQKAKRTYGMREKQFRLFFDRAQKKGDAGENLFRMLEMRLDNVIYRLGFAPSRAAARQMVSHGMFSVNTTKVNIASYLVKPGDVIKIRANKRKNKTFVDLAEKIKRTQMPSWLNYDAKEDIAKVLHEPKKDDLDKSLNAQAIVEFYSK
ncbi:MAG: 30S ribosomal protein S4 [Candidatus Falkowbacteria bacterium]